MHLEKIDEEGEEGEEGEEEEGVRSAGGSWLGRSLVYEGVSFLLVMLIC